MKKALILLVIAISSFTFSSSSGSLTMPLTNCQQQAIRIYLIAYQFSGGNESYALQQANAYHAVCSLSQLSE